MIVHLCTTAFIVYNMYTIIYFYSRVEYCRTKKKKKLRPFRKNNNQRNFFFFFSFDNILDEQQCQSLPEIHMRGWMRNTNTQCQGRNYIECKKNLYAKNWHLYCWPMYVRNSVTRAISTYNLGLCLACYNAVIILYFSRYSRRARRTFTPQT